MPAISITIDPLPLVIRSPFLKLTGFKDATINAIFINGDSSTSSFPTATSWEASVHLSVGDTLIAVYGKDIALNTTELVTLTATLPKLMPVLDSLYNSLDDKALEIMLERIPGEKNLYLKNRILSAEEFPSNCTYLGLVRGISRELSLDIDKEVFTITPIEDSTSRTLRATNAFITIEPHKVVLEADEFRKDSEAVVIDVGSGEYTLTKIPRHIDEFQLQSPAGKRLEKDEFEIVRDNVLRVFRPDLLYLASYTYVEEISLSDTTTLANLETSIEALTGIHGNTLWTVSVASGFTTSGAKYLVRVFRETIERTGLKLDLAAVKLSELSNKDYRDSLLNAFGSYTGTKLETYGDISRKKGRIFLQDMILDQDTLVEYRGDEELSALPHLHDAQIRYYTCEDPTDATRYTEVQYKSGAGFCPNHPTKNLKAFGVLTSDLQSGSGYDTKMVDVR